ncbi:hypothetical protein ELQ90_00660 [Labedella phragmitis]|uniref:Uncharacterized protein n=1 Tax=Labedella phragmitis TaxID=2498849 RepID=A0A3S3ZS79_9MICO|nr:hypothetical protein [Labedella phragmitis]RWZ52505.1 hypothetical protein ELQ90_00660 [Labedella phragmitis]
MRRTIGTEYPRTLVLENVVRRRIRALDPGHVRDTAVALVRDIRDSGGTPRGPLVQRLTPRANEDHVVAHETALMRQSATPLSPADLPPDVEVEPRVEVSDCILVRFRGDVSDLDVVYSKINVSAYENEIELDGTVYLVFAGEDGTSVEVDAFAPAVSREP